MNEYPKIIEAYRHSKEGEITIKSIVVNNSQEEQNFKEQYSKHKIKGRTLTPEEKQQGDKLVLPKGEEPNTELVESLDLTLAWFARDVEDFNFSDTTPTVSIDETSFLQSIINLYPQLNNHRFLYFNRTMLRKLVNDGYLFFDNGRYGITIEGIIFHLEGGYAAQIASLDADRRLKRFLDRQPSRLNTLTLWLAIGSIALFLIELVKMIHEWHVQKP